MKKLQVSMPDDLHELLAQYAKWDRRSVNNAVNWAVSSFLKSCDQSYRDHAVDLNKYLDGLED